MNAGENVKHNALHNRNCFRLALLLAVPMIAACTIFSTRVGSDHLPAEKVSHASSDRAIAYVQENHQRYGIADATKEFAFQSEKVDQLEQRHVRLQQVYRGIPVWGQQLVVHFSERGEPRSISGTYRAINAQLDMEFRISPAEATAMAIQNRQGNWHGSGDPIQYIYLGPLRPAIVYKVTITDNQKSASVFVDAGNGSVLHEISDIQEASGR